MHIKNVKNGSCDKQSGDYRYLSAVCYMHRCLESFCLSLNFFFFHLIILNEIFSKNVVFLLSILHILQCLDSFCGMIFF